VWWRFAIADKASKIMVVLALGWITADKSVAVAVIEVLKY
jgi:hypothetical protein